MAVYEIDFKLQHDCPYNNLSRKYPNVLFSQWCNYSMEVLEVSFKELNELSEFQAVQEDIQQYLTKLGTKIARKSFSGSNTQIIVHECICDTVYKSVTSVLEKHNCLACHGSDGGARMANLRLDLFALQPEGHQSCLR